MLTPEYLGDASAYLVRLYDDLEDEIIRDIARRIVKTGELTGTAKWQYQQLQHIGALQQDILQKVAEHTGKTDAEIRRVFAEAMDINIRSNAAPLIAHGIAVDVSLSPQQRQILEAMVQRTSGSIQNLTMTTGTTGSQLYYECSNMAYMKVISGAYSPAQAIFEAVKEAGREGATVAYPSRTDKLDVAIRRNVLTSLNQTAGRITEMNAKDLDAEYYETSAHPGARPSHAEWQGQVFKIEGATADYPNFEESTGYGDAGGLCGINCRHSFFLFWPGISERAYSPEKLDEYANHTVEYNGDEYHDYEASQIQRKFERSIRESKRELAAIDAAREAAEDEETAKLLDEHFRSESVVLKEKEARLKDFLQQTGRDAEKDRVRVPGFNKSVSQKSVWANKGYENLDSSAKMVVKSISGARNPFSDAANKHAERYYDLVRSMKTDVDRIAKATGYTRKEIRDIKNFIFYDKHDLGNGKEERFAPDFMMAQSWQRLIDGKPEKHDLTLIKHEIMEKSLIADGLSQHDAHIITSKKYDYATEAKEFYAKIKKYKK